MHNKKLLATFLLSALMLALCAFTFAGCCRHGHESKNIDATCTEPAYYEDVCFKCGNINERYELSPALGHDYEGGFCNRCGEPDPDDTTLSEGQAEKLNLSEDGVLSWKKLKNATKYEFTVTLPGESEEQTITVAKNKGSLDLETLFKLDENTAKSFPVGRTFAKFVHYELYKETIEGETIEQEVPMNEYADEFRIIKRNGKFEMERMGYSDENITLNGFYSSVKTDENGEYYLYELLLNEENKPEIFNLIKNVKLALGCNAYYYRTEKDRENGTNAISSFDWPYMTFPAGSTDIFMRVNAPGGNKDYKLKIYGLRNMEVKRYKMVDSQRQPFGSKIVCREGDIISCERLFADSGFYGAYEVRDSAYNYIGSAKDEYVHPDLVYKGAADYTAEYVRGDGAELYFYPSSSEDNNVKTLCEEYARHNEKYIITEQWDEYNILKGYNLVYRILSTATEAVIPSTVCDKEVLSVDFMYANYLDTITVEEMRALPKLTLHAGITTVNLGSIFNIHSGAFVGANTNLVINCDFDESRAGSFDKKWNYIDPNNQYSTATFKVVYKQY